MAYRTIKGVVDHMNDIYNINFKPGESKKNYYVGITGDDENQEATLRRHKIGSFLAIVECETADIAAQAETALGDEGFDIGNPPHEGNGGNEDSKFVYIFKKTANTDPSL